MTITAIDHVQLPFPEGEQSVLRHFYTHLLGLREIRDAGGATLRFEAGAQRLDLVPVAHLPTPREPAHLALRVLNLAGLRARLLADGYVLDESRPLPGHLRFYLQDPGGNALELLESVPEAAR